MHVLVLVDESILTWVENAQPCQVVGFEAFGDGHTGGRQHGFADVAGDATLDADQGVGLFDSGAEDAARPAQIGRVAAVDASGGDEGAGDRVPGEARVLRSFHAEADGSRAVDAGGVIEAGRTGRMGGVRHRTPPAESAVDGDCGAASARVSGRGWPMG